MKAPRSIQTRCDCCGTNIYYGNASVTFSRNIEQVDWTPAHRNATATVIHSVVLMTLCAGCGKRFDEKLAAKALEAAVKQPAEPGK